ncbi:MAG: AAA family ATPase [Alphaproteobacteria bacterium]|nr:AAA family ATPase [Alphaproteobacteria bacterium]
MPTVHFLCGYMGFGKSTIARRLAIQYNAVILNNDEFMRELFGRSLPEDEFQKAHDKVSKFTWQLGERIISIGTSVIFDRGFWSRKSRKEAVERAGIFCDSIQFHQIECDMETAKQRVLNRTATNGDALDIDEETFDRLAHCYEPISPDENLNVIYYKNTLPLFS